MFHLGDDYFYPTKILLPPEDNGDRLLTNVTIKVVEDVLKRQMGNGSNPQLQSCDCIRKMKEIITYSQIVDHLEAPVNKENETNDDLYELRALIGQAPNPNMKRANNVLDELETGEKTYETLSVLPTDDPIKCSSYTEGNGISHLDSWKKFKNLAKRDKHDVPCIA